MKKLTLARVLAKLEDMLDRGMSVSFDPGDDAKHLLTIWPLGRRNILHRHYEGNGLAELIVKAHEREAL